MKTLRPEEAEKLGRLFLNSHRFYWGIFNLNQPEVYQLLRKRYGLDFKTGTYLEVCQQLLERPGIQKLVDIAETEVYKQVGDELLGGLIEGWNTGKRPFFDGRGTNPHRYAGLLETTITSGKNGHEWYVTRWGEFAPVFFEDFLR